MIFVQLFMICSFISSESSISTLNLLAINYFYVSLMNLSFSFSCFYFFFSFSPVFFPVVVCFNFVLPISMQCPLSFSCSIHNFPFSSLSLSRSFYCSSILLVIGIFQFVTYMRFYMAFNHAFIHLKHCLFAIIEGQISLSILLYCQPSENINKIF